MGALTRVDAPSRPSSSGDQLHMVVLPMVVQVVDPLGPLMNVELPIRLAVVPSDPNVVLPIWL